MSLKIEIILPDDQVSKYSLDYHMEALGFSRGEQPRTGSGLVGSGPIKVVEPATATEIVELEKNGGSPEQSAPTSVRERGKPAPGRARRTKEEIAEDEAAERAETASTQQGISTGEECVGPEDTPEVQEQDKADEQAEVEATRKEPFTIDDVKAAVGEYVNKFGMDAAQADGPGLFVDVLGNPPEGQNFWKMSILPNDQAALQKVVEGWKNAAKADERYKRRGA